MPPIAEETHPSQGDLNDTEDPLEGEESDEYDIEVCGNCFCIFFLFYVAS